MEAYYINLKRSEYRNKRFLSEGALVHFPNINRFDAIDGKTLNLQDHLANYTLSLKAYYSIKNQERLHKDDIGTAGAFGCYLSHVGVWKQFLKGTKDHCIIFEDDADVKDGDSFKIVKYLQNPPSYDVLLFHRNQVIKDDANGNVKSYFGMYAYAISREGAQKILKGVFPATQQIDAYLSNNIEKRGFRIKNVRDIQVSHHLSFGFSDVGHWEVYKNYLALAAIGFIILILITFRRGSRGSRPCTYPSPLPV